jgi:hypothetical protein
MTHSLHPIDPQLSLAILFLAISDHRSQEVANRMEREQDRLSRQLELMQQEEPERWDGLL